MEKKLEILENKLKELNKKKLIEIALDSAKDGKRAFNRIVSSVYNGYDELKA